MSRWRMDGCLFRSDQWRANFSESGHKLLFCETEGQRSFERNLCKSLQKTTVITEHYRYTG